MAAGGGAGAVVIAGRDIVAPADAGLGETLAAGRDMVDEADGGAPAPTAGRDPVAEPEAGAAGRDPVAEAEADAAGRDPVAEADAGDIGFGAGLPAAPAGVTALGAAEGAALAPAAGISVVPHCTQNFAPG
jgi:hypothetical protein